MKLNKKEETKMIKAAQLYYDLLNLYGDSGNMKALSFHLKQSGVELTEDRLSLGESLKLTDYDFLCIGSGTEHNLLLALDDLLAYREELDSFRENGGVLLATGNSIELFGRSITIDGHKREALGLFDYEVSYGERIVRDVCTPCTLISQELIGFENHSGHIESKEVIIRDKGFLMTYLIGPLLVRNPLLNRWLIELLCEKTGDKPDYSRLDYSLEEEAYKAFRDSMKDNIR